MLLPRINLNKYVPQMPNMKTSSCIDMRKLLSPSKAMFISCMLCIGAQSFICLHNSVTLLSMNDIYLFHVLY